MAHRIAVYKRPEITDALGAKTARRIARDLDVQVERVDTVEVYVVDGELTSETLDRVAEQVFTDPVLEQAVVDGLAPGTGRVHLSLGVGNGRFAEKPLNAQKDGKGKDGTYVFGNVALEVARNLNVIGDWDGLGLNAGLSYTLPISVIPACLWRGSRKTQSNFSSRW